MFLCVVLLLLGLWCEARNLRTHIVFPQQQSTNSDDVTRPVRQQYTTYEKPLQPSDGSVFSLKISEDFEQTLENNEDTKLLRWCSHTGLLVEAKNTRAQNTFALGGLVVELVTVTSFKFPRNGDQEMDTPWFNSNDAGYGCEIPSSEHDQWLAHTSIPNYFRQRSSYQPKPFAQNALDPVEIDAQEYFAEGSTSDNAQHTTPSDQGISFAELPQNCFVISRRLPLTPTANPNVFVFPFSPDASSQVFFFRITILSLLPNDGPSETYLTPILRASHKSDAYPTHQCDTPHRATPSGSDVQPAFNSMSVTPINGDHCTPTLHCVYCPLASHFALYHLDSSNSVIGNAAPNPTTQTMLSYDVEFLNNYSQLKAKPTVTTTREVILNGANPQHVITVVAGQPTQLVVRALTEVRLVLGDAVEHVTFLGRLISRDRIVNVDFPPGAQYNSELDGYVLTFDVREPGEYVLEVFLSWVYGDNDQFVGPEPVLLGPHIGHQWRYCHHRRALIFGAPWVVTVLPAPIPLQVWGNKKCATATNTGRWVLMGQGESCKPPICSAHPDAEEETIKAMGWHGERDQWVWVPYSCYYHLYSASDIEYCAKQTNTHWLLINGDSQVREMMEHLHLVCNYTDVFGKFASLERPQMVPGLRVTFQFFEYAYSQVGNVGDVTGNRHPFSRGWWPYLQHFNIAPSCNSGRPIMEYIPNSVTDPEAERISTIKNGDLVQGTILTDVEADRPDVWVWNPAFAYAAQDMPLDEFKTWLDTAVEYMKHAGIFSAQSVSLAETNTAAPSNFAGSVLFDCRATLSNATVQKAIKNLQAKSMRVLWFTAPFTLSQAHANSRWLTQNRVSLYNHLALETLRPHVTPPLSNDEDEPAGSTTANTFGIADVGQITQSRMEDSWDGLHYMRSTIEDPGHGLVSSMAQQVVLNAVWGTCTSQTP